MENTKSSGSKKVKTEKKEKEQESTVPKSFFTDLGNAHEKFKMTSGARKGPAPIGKLPELEILKEEPYRPHDVEVTTVAPRMKKPRKRKITD